MYLSACSSRDPHDACYAPLIGLCLNRRGSQTRNLATVPFPVFWYRPTCLWVRMVSLRPLRPRRRKFDSFPAVSIPSFFVFFFSSDVSPLGDSPKAYSCVQFLRRSSLLSQVTLYSVVSSGCLFACLMFAERIPPRNPE